MPGASLAARGTSRRGRASESCGRDQGARGEAGVGSPLRPRATQRSAANLARPSGSGGGGPSALFARQPRRAHSSGRRAASHLALRRSERDPHVWVADVPDSQRADAPGGDDVLLLASIEFVPQPFPRLVQTDRDRRRLHHLLGTRRQPRPLTRRTGHQPTRVPLDQPVVSPGRSNPERGQQERPSEPLQPVTVRPRPTPPPRQPHLRPTRREPRHQRIEQVIRHRQPGLPRVPGPSASHDSLGPADLCHCVPHRIPFSREGWVFELSTMAFEPSPELERAFSCFRAGVAP